MLTIMFTRIRMLLMLAPELWMFTPENYARLFTFTMLFTLLFMLVCSLDLTFRVLERETARDYFERRRRSHAPPGLPSLLRPAAPARLVPTEVQGCSYAAQPGAQPEQPRALAVAS